MKKLSIIISLLFVLFSCNNNTPSSRSPVIYQPLATHTPLMHQDSFFQDIAQLGFDTLLLSTQHFNTSTLTQAIKFAHQADLFVFLALEPSASLEQEIQQWIFEHHVDGFILNHIDRFSDKERLQLAKKIRHYAKIMKKDQKIWGTTGYFWGQSQEMQRELFIEGTFGTSGKRKGLHTFLNSYGSLLLEQALQPEPESPALLNLFHNTRNLYGKHAVAVTMIPPIDASNSSKSAPLLWFSVTLPQPFIYTAMLAPNQDMFLQNHLPPALALRNAHPALQHGRIQLLGHSTTVYSDLVRYRSKQVVRLMNFGNERSILNLTFMSNVISGKKLVDASTGEVIERVNRGFHIPIEAGASRIFIVQ